MIGSSDIDNVSDVGDVGDGRGLFSINMCLVMDFMWFIWRSKVSQLASTDNIVWEL